MTRSGKVKYISIILFVMVMFSAISIDSIAIAQNGSMFNRTSSGQPMMLNQYSYTFQAPPKQEEFRLHDIITVLVDEQSVFISDGEMDRKKKAHANFTLSDWVKLKGLSLMPVAQPDGDPKIAGSMDQKYRSEASLETRDKLEFSITCEIVDVRPNGNLVIEGHDTVVNNEEEWTYQLNGEIRPGDVQRDNTVLSSNILHKMINKQESGHVRDGYRRGWLMRWMDQFQVF